MKPLFALVVILFIGLNYGLTHNSTSYTSANPLMLQADEPGTGNDGEDTSERSFMCRLFNVFCSER